MEEPILLISSFIFCFIGRLTLYLISKMTKKKGKKKREKTGISVEMKYLSTKFKIPIKKLDTKIFGTIISLIDALIISGTLLIVINITSSVTLELLIGLILVILLIYVTYEILGRILILKGMNKDEL